VYGKYSCFDLTVQAMVFFRLLLFSAVLLLIEGTRFRPEFPRDKECVPAFNSTEHRSSFDVCLENECFVFRTELPFVYIDKGMRNIEDQRPFLCSDFHKLYSGELKGAFFDIVKRMRPLQKTAHCVWAGPKCTFDGILNFINASATSGDKHRWISGGVLMVVPYRIGVHTLPSASLFEDELRVVGPPLSGYTSPSEAWSAIWKPFTLKGWIFIFSCTFGHFLIRILFSFVFTIPKWLPTGAFDWRQFKSRLLNIKKEKQDDNEEVEEAWERISYLWSLIATIFVAITILFWEVAIAVQVYEARMKAPIENLDPKRFTIVENTSWENIFADMLGQGHRSNWHRSRSMEQIYDELLNEKNEIDYTIMYELFNRFKFNEKPELCEKLRVYDDVPSQLVHNREPPQISAVWFYSSNVPLSRRIAIDRAIAKMKSRGRILKIANDYAGEGIADECKLQTERIDWILLALLHSVVTGGLFLWLMFSILWFSMQRRPKRCPEERQDAEDSTEESSILTLSDGKTRQGMNTQIASFCCLGKQAINAH